MKNTPLSMSTNGTQKKPLSKNTSSGFTLVELIVVITILAVLGTIGLVSFSGFQKNARDSKRVSNVATITKGFDIAIASGKRINTSETATGANITLEGSGVNMTGYHGIINNALLVSLKVHSKDIIESTDTPYTYSYFPNERYFQVTGFLEDSSNLPNVLGFIDLAYAEDADTGFVYIKGNFTATGGINSLIPDPIVWSGATVDATGAKIIAGSGTVVTGANTTIPVAPPVVTPDCTIDTDNIDGCNIL